MPKASYTKKNECLHGKDRKEICFLCVAAGAYIKQAIEKLNKIYSKKGGVSFEVAFALAGEFKRWLKMNKIKAAIKEASIDWFLNDLKEKGRISEEKKSDFKLAYNVAKHFPDLKIPSKRKLPFGCYRVISSANIKEWQKNDLRKESEDDGISINNIYDILRERYNIGRIKRISTTIIFTSKEEFLKRINEFLTENKEITKGDQVTLLAKVDRRKKVKNS